MRVVVSSIHNETNTFSPIPVDIEDFEVLHGSEVLKKWGHGPIPGLSYKPLEGIVSTLQAHGVEVIPIIAADALPGGMVTLRTYEILKEALLEGIRKVGTIDGVCLQLHGSMFVQDIGHAESDILASIRALTGRRMPIVAALDLHANITDVMVASADGLVLYRTAPHADAYETGQRAAELLYSAANGFVKLTMAITKIPMLVPGERSMTAAEPMCSMMRLLDETDAKPNVVSSSFALANAWIDVYGNSASALVITDGNQTMAQREADRLAKTFWQHRTEFNYSIEAYPVDEGIDIALSAPEKTVFLSDSGDDSTGGATSDTTFVLERLLAKGVGDTLMAAICDPAAVNVCEEAGKDQTVTVSVGGKMDKIYSRPLPVTGKVCLVSHQTLEMGPIAVLQIEGIKVVLSKKRIAVYDPAQLRGLDIEPLQHKLVVLKMGYLSPQFQAIAPRSILMLSPGCTNQDLTQLRFERVKRSLYPIDPDAVWTPKS